MADKGLSLRFWQALPFLSAFGTALLGARLLSTPDDLPVHARTQGSRLEERRTARPELERAVPSMPGVDPLFARLALAASGPERCALLERIVPSDDAGVTYAIATVLERAQLISVRACAAQALARQPTVEARSWLLDLAEDPEPEVHRRALEGLASRDDAARSVVIEATHSEDLELRLSAVTALLNAKREEGYAAAVLLLPLVEDAETLSSLIDALGQSRDARAAPALEALLDSADRDSHLHAIRALGELGARSMAGRLEALLQLGSDEEFSAAAEALNRVAPERAAARLRSVLAFENGERQWLALSALLALDQPNSSAVIRAQLHGDDPRRTMLVLRHLTSRPDASFEAELIVITERQAPRLSFSALQALSKLATPSAQSAVQRIARSLPESLAARLGDSLAENADQARERRLAALTRAEDVAPSTLFELARDPTATSRDALLRYLDGHDVAAGVWAKVTEFAAEATVQRIVDRQASLQASVRDAVFEGLGRRGDPRFADVLRAAMQGEARNGALSALVQLGDPSVLPELQQLAKDEDAGNRRLAVQLLSTGEDPRAVQELERLGSDADAQVMSSALQALQTRSPELVGRLAEQALRAASPEARVDVLSALSDLKASLSRPLFELALSDADDSVAIQAIASLASLQGPASAQRLFSVVNDGHRSEEVRKEAASSLRRLGGPLARAHAELLASLSEPETVEEFVCSPQ
jgi:HEAT repeat protein